MRNEVKKIIERERRAETEKSRCVTFLRENREAEGGRIE